MADHRVERSIEHISPPAGETADVLKALAGRRVATTVSSSDAPVRDHLVHSVPVLPGVFLLDLVLRLVRQAGVDPGDVELRRILFLAPVIGTDTGCRIEVAVAKENTDGALPVTVRSRPADEPTSAWENNCEAQLRPSSTRVAGHLDVDQVMDRQTRSMDIDDVYGFARNIDIHHHGFMKASGRVHSGRNEALARMQIAPAAEPYLDHFHAHPAILDFATLVPLVTFDEAHRTSAEHAFIPIYIDSFHAPGGMGVENLVHIPGPVNGGLDSELFDADIEVCSPDGTVVARLSGFRAKRIRSADLITQKLTSDAATPRSAEERRASKLMHHPHRVDRMGDLLTSLVAEHRGGEPEDVDPDLGFYDLGLTSVDLLTLANDLERHLGTQLYPTLLFEYPSVRALSDHLREEGHGPTGGDGATAAPESTTQGAATPEEGVPGPQGTASFGDTARGAAWTPAPRAQRQQAPPADEEESPLAIVGLAGRYPHAATPDELWELLRAGQDSVTEIPATRWDHTAYFDAQPGTPGRTYSKWGAFCDDIAEFDAPFFHITARQAELMDPQERLFLQTAWEVLEDAGHTPEGLAAQTDGSVGVFAGVMWNDYQLHGLDQLRDGTPEIGGSWSSALSNRVSYGFDFRGPSITVDTACSAALTALHLAGESIRRGECRAALVGGVNLSLHPYKYLRLAELGLLSTDGRSRPFGKDADGYVPGEGVGAVLVRPLADAWTSGDHVYGLIRGSALRHSGRTGGYTVPSPDAQTRVVSAALDSAGVPADSIGYVEAHGSGTALGDQIEIDALTTAYAEHTDARAYCAIGSVKSSIGHLEAAAGIAGLTKLLMSLRHRTLPAGADIGEQNPAIDFDGTPFYLLRANQPWAASTDPDTGLVTPRRAALSAFGAGGANVHLIVEEAAPSTHSNVPVGERRAADGRGQAPDRFTVPISAQSEEQVRTLAGRIAHQLRTDPEIPLVDVAHTLRNGRRALPERVAVVVRDPAELASALEEISAGRSPQVASYWGRVGPGASAGPNDPPAEELSEDRVAERWVAGQLRTWPEIPDARRLALPTYPFARERYWLGDQPDTVSAELSDDALFYSARWQRRSLPKDKRANPFGRDVLLIFDEDETRVTEFRARCQRVIMVRPGASFTRVSTDCYEIAPGDGEHYRMLARSLSHEGIVPAAVLHLWSVRIGAPTGLTDTSALMSVFQLCRTWALDRTDRMPVVHAYRTETVSPAQTAVGGFARSVRLEQPKLAVVTVRLGAADGGVATLLAEAAEATSATARTQVRYEDGERSVLGFVPLTVPDDALRSMPLTREGGTYLITGGAGGLGLHTARLLASSGTRVALVLVGRSAPSAQTDAAVAEIEALGAQAAYLSADVTDQDAVHRAVAETTGRFGPLTGVIHSAGVTDDALLVNKTAEAAGRVLAPKVHGAVNLDLATSTEHLDYFLLYSSVASVLGSSGASDYAAANRYLDAFAAWRAERVRAGDRHGRSVAVNWPLWREGGMSPDPEVMDLILARAGARPLETNEGLAALRRLLDFEESQVVVAKGDRARLEERMGIFHQASPLLQTTEEPSSAGSAPQEIDEMELHERTVEYLDRLVADLTNVDQTAWNSVRTAETGLMDRGLTSGHVVELVERLDHELGARIQPTTLFRYSDVSRLAGHLVQEHRDKVTAYLNHHAVERGDPAGAGPAAVAPPVGVSASPVRATDSQASQPTPDPAEQPIAIIGMAGRFPGSDSTSGFWDDLMAGRDLMTPVPSERWDHSLHHDPTGTRPHGTDCGHGAFLDDVSRFDAHFFDVPRAAAEGMDPQARLLLEVLHEAAEDAAVAGQLRGSATGTFVGRCFNDYDEEMLLRGRKLGAHDVTGTSVAMTANRAAHHFDLTGPSQVVDTACSSSLYALHHAVSALRRGECTMAFAAGTNLILSPLHYLRSSALGALSPSGRCHSFDARADGYVPAEAIAAVLLKPLDQARADGDPVHAVIRSVAVNHGGRSGALTAPRPDRETELLLSAWSQAGIDPESLTYLEAHGTGTGLGDPIEVEAAVAAFGEHTRSTGFCALGSAKAHLGHAEGAAGMVGVIKTVLSMRHRRIPAMPAFETVNPHCAIDDGPLFINRQDIPWEPPPGTPRRAGVSSFGFGGAYAHAVLEEAPTATLADTAPARALLFPFSARDDEALRTLVRRHREFLADRPDIRLDQVAASLISGREAMPRRMVVIADSYVGLLTGLDAFLTGAVPSQQVYGDGSGSSDHTTLWALAGRWTAAEPVSLPTPDVPRLALPTHPFGGERYWFEEAGAGPTAVTPVPASPDRPLPRAGGAEPSAQHVVDQVNSFVSLSGFSGRHAALGMDRLDDLLRRWCRYLFAEGPDADPPTTAGIRARLADESEYGRLADALADLVGRALPGHGHRYDGRQEQDQIAADMASLGAEHPELAPWVDLVRACVPKLPDILAGRTDALEVFFSAEHPDLLRNIYDGNEVADHHNEIVARAVGARVRELREARPERPVRLLEVGAGTGGTTRRLLEVLGEHGAGVSYLFTDVSPAFLPTARSRFAASPVDFSCRALDLDSDPEDQGFASNSVDLVIAANSVHATRRVSDSLARIRRLLAPGGVLVLQELVRNRDCMTPMIGPLPGYWSSVDPAERLAHSPFLSARGWRTALAAQDFAHTWVLGAPDLAEEELDNAVVLSQVPTAVEGSVPSTAARTDTFDSELPPAPASEPGPSATDEAGTDEDAFTVFPAHAVQPIAQTGEIQVRLREVFARFFGLATDEVDIAAPFEQYGMDSLSAIQLIQSLEPEFGKLPKVLLYEHPTIGDLADYLVAQAPVPSSTPPTTSDEHAAAGAEPATVTTSGLPASADMPAEGPPTQATEEADPIAIVGMAGRYANSPDLVTWWRNLRDGTNLVSEIPAGRFDWREVFGDPHRSLGKVNSRWGSFIDGVDHFDAGFFGMTPLEAELMDPQQRIMLETTWQAVEDSGHRPSELAGSRTGVFIGATSHDYDWQLQRAGRHREGHVVSGNGHCLIANRISHQLDLRGPSEAVDTACSSSLTALHRGVRAVQHGECEAAIVGGVHLFLTADLFVALGQLGIMSPQGRCAAFDRNADGMVRGEGAAAVMVKPLSRALADGDEVYAVVRGSGVSHGGGGHMNSLMMPNPSAQAELITSVYRDADVDPRTISYVEAHGTGTEVGDPIEVRGLRKAFDALRDRPDAQPETPWCALGTVKSNVGHTEAAAGLTGVVKTVLALRHGQLPPLLHLNEANPLLEMEDSPFYLVDRLTRWPETPGHPRRAGVSAFGLGGTNAHVLLEEYRRTRPGHAAMPGTDSYVVPLSARTPERLREYARRLHDSMRTPAMDGTEPLDLSDLAYTLRVGRDEYEHRMAVVARSTGELVELLNAHLDGAEQPQVLVGSAVSARPDVREEADTDPAAAARRWVEGGPHWQPARGDRPPLRVPLVTYPFEPQRHWAESLDDGETPQGQASSEELAETLRALNEGRLTVDEVEQRMEGVR